jgi:hypothetical protein
MCFASSFLHHARALGRLTPQQADRDQESSGTVVSFVAFMQRITTMNLT